MPPFWSPRRAYLTVVLLAALLRLWAALVLPTDFDEPIYLQAGRDYARLMREGDWQGVIDYERSREHPPLVKLLYGGVWLALGEKATFDEALLGSRLLSATLGTLAVAVWAGVDPLAGLLLAIHTLAVKYTSQAYLEAWPHLFALLAIALVWRWRQRVKKPSGSRHLRGARPDLGATPQVWKINSVWLWLAAIALGLTAAGKYTYLLAVVPVVALVLEKMRRAQIGRALAWGVGYGLLAALVFWAFNPTLWHDPLKRLSESLFFHARYSQGQDVAEAAYPWFQPFIWLLTAPAGEWHPEVFFYVGFDGLFFWLMLGSLWRVNKKTFPGWAWAWVLLGLGVLLLWPTKWPQYTLILAPGVCWLAAQAGRRLYHWGREQEAYWEWAAQVLPNPSRVMWIVTGLFVLALASIYFYGLGSVLLGSRNWAQLDRAQAALPSNTVYATLPLADGRVAFGTAQGLAMWAPDTLASDPANWQVFTPQNTPLPTAEIVALAQDAAGWVWLGTTGGIARWDGAAQWEVFAADELGLPTAAAPAVLIAQNGEVWWATQAGGARWDGAAWMAYTPENSGLRDARLFAVAQTPDGALWFGSLSHLDRFDPATNTWETIPTSLYGPGTVRQLFVDSTGRLWVATQGNGASVWDGAQWQRYQVSNSGLPFSTVNAIFEAPAGTLWFATARPLDVGGALASWDGTTWRPYTHGNSGFSDAEPLHFALDAEQRLWIGTRTGGVEIYQLER